jgi:cobalt transporter subunit CbtB
MIVRPDSAPSLSIPPQPDARILSDARAGRMATAAPALATVAVGLAVLFCVGFLQTPAVHNGVHDTRHANGFPCH